MSDLASLTREALALPLDERIQLAQELWASLETTESAPRTDEEKDAIRIALERDDELANGVVEGVSHEEAMEKVRKTLGCE